MSRISRRNKIIASPENKTFNTALYIRLSSEGTVDNSDSIENQRALLLEYISNKPEFLLYSVYCDHNATGTNFSRLEFVRLMKDIEAGLVNCIVVKDLSRLGRNYIETGNFIEKIFPDMGVRFISVNDQYDSIDNKPFDAGLSVALKNIINDMYSKDISKKICSALETKQKLGDFIGSHAAYGYKKSDSNKNKLVIDKKTAPIVKLIFELRLNGAGYTEIARHLTEIGIQTPTNYRIAEKTPASWNMRTVKQILRNPVYIGNTVQGRRKQSLYKGMRRQNVPPENWIVVENTHEPIIGKVLYEKVQQMKHQQMKDSAEQRQTGRNFAD